MGKAGTIKLSIPQPCSQNWDEMSITDKGRFCDSCNKTVIDFTNYSDQQLADFFKRSKAHTCGKFRNDQLEKPLYTLQSSQNRSLPQLLVSAALAIGAINNANASGKQKDHTAIHAVWNTEKEGEKNNSTTGGDSAQVVSGRIIDRDTRLEVPGATVIVEGGRMAVTADVNGVFKLVIPDHVTTDTIQLTVMHTHYFNQTVKCAAGDLPMNITIELRPIEFELKSANFVNQLSGRVGGISVRNAPLRYRVKLWFRRAFYMVSRHKTQIPN
jgi:hypothetical protein